MKSLEIWEKQAPKGCCSPFLYSEGLGNCSFPINSREATDQDRAMEEGAPLGESGGNEATEPRKRPGSPSILPCLPCEAPLSWLELPGWPALACSIHALALRPILS